jgi:hypothetical protein
MPRSIAKELLAVGSRWPTGEVVTDSGRGYVFTTAQQQCDEIEAATFTYNWHETPKGTVQLRKHTVIKGRPAVKMR